MIGFVGTAIHVHSVIQQYFGTSQGKYCSLKLEIDFLFFNDKMGKGA